MRSLRGFIFWIIINNDQLEELFFCSLFFRVFRWLRFKRTETRVFMTKKIMKENWFRNSSKGWLAFFRFFVFVSFFLFHRSLSDALNSLPVFMKPFRTVKNEFYLFEGRLFYLQVFILYFCSYFFFSWSCFGLQQKSNLYLIYTSTFFFSFRSRLSSRSVHSFLLMIFMIFPKLTCALVVTVAYCSFFFFFFFFSFSPLWAFVISLLVFVMHELLNEKKKRVRVKVVSLGNLVHFVQNL